TLGAARNFPLQWPGGVPSGMLLCQHIRDPVQGMAQSRSRLSSRRASFPCLAEIAEDIGPGFLEVGVTLQSTLEHGSDAVLGFGPRQRCSKRSEGIQEPIGWGQRDLVDETLRCRDGTLVEGG